MADQDSSNDSGMHIRPKQLAGASTGAGERRLKKEFLDITALIRSIQISEGNVDCFRRGKDHCDQVDCAWRQYCLEGDQTSDGGEIKRGENSDPNR